MHVLVELTICVIALDLLFKRLFRIKSKKYYAITMCLLFTLTLGLRLPESCGVDTTKYLFYFNKFIDLDFPGVAIYAYKDPVFFYLEKIFGMIIPDFQAFLIVVSAFCMIVFSRFVYKYSSNQMLSYVLFLGLGYYGTYFQVLRHIIALSFLLLAFDYLKAEKLTKYLIMVFFACCFHITAIVFLPAYFLKNYKINKKYLITISLLGILVVANNSRVISIIESIPAISIRFNSIIQNQPALNNFGILFSLLMFVIPYILNRKNKQFLNENRIYFSFSYIGLILMMFSTVIGEFNRLSMFYGIFNLILFPNAIQFSHSFNNRDKQIVIASFTILFALYFIFLGIENCDLNNYQFFWI